MTDRALDLLNEAKKYLASGEDKQRKADADKWAAAERMWQANKEEGASQREIASVVGTNQTNVLYAVRLWEAHGDSDRDQRPSYAEAYYELRAEGGSGDMSYAGVQDRGALAVLRDPQRRQAILDRLPVTVAEEVAADAVRAADREDRAVRHERGEATAADAAGSSRVQMRLSEITLRSQRLTAEREGISAIAVMDVDEFYRHFVGISGSDAGLRNLARTVDEAIDKLVALRERLPEGDREPA